MIKRQPTVHLNGLIILVTVLAALSSCVSSRKVRYFRDIADTTHGSRLASQPFKDPVIQPDDILSISIQTIDPQNSTIINQMSGAMPSVGSSSASPIGQQVVTGFIVDKQGEVELAMIGKVKLAGKTTAEARDTLRTLAGLYFKNCTVNVRFVNYKITVLGEVNRPATYTVPNEKISLLDALGLAGDLTIYGKRNNVLLIRESEKGGKEVERFNLNSSDIFKSPYFYLRQNDVIYVEPNKAKAASLNTARAQTFALIGTMLSVLIVLFSRVNFK
ncbi:MAG TPA: polysaccharide biosynthesis/export family protein [Cytophagaceae bacterium]|jgi:polysaccharide export outer membrane protein|nr:polysaccharide biosynthesis/export family protein [Cytophagaceae bacterium]